MSEEYSFSHEEPPPVATGLETPNVPSWTLKAKRLNSRPDPATRIRKKRGQKALGRRIHVSEWLLTAAFLWLLVVQLSGVFLFLRGFLLARRELTQVSECSAPPVDVGLTDSGGNYEDGCWMPAKFEKAVVIVVDALRYDFVVPEDDPDKAKLYQNSFPFLYDTALNKPQQAVLRPFIADPPTTTLQRLKGLTVGTLPTFVDAGANFAGMVVGEDNLISQLRSAGKNIVHLGDDTWNSLFPGAFDEDLSRPFESFNVWDLHTLDTGVNNHIFPLLRQNQQEKKWDVLIAHYLGVDHAGHRYGPEHPAMAAKLKQMNMVIQTVAENIDDKTLLVVMGDHGMDSKGDHGGESALEVESTLWMYSTRPVFGRAGLGFGTDMTPPRTANDRPLPQVDFVPTLALLLGIPIPYSSLGAPMEEAFLGPQGNDHLSLARARRLASSQVRRYLRAYDGDVAEEDGGGGRPNAPRSDALWSQASATWEVVTGLQNPGGYDWRSASRRYENFLIQIRAEARSRWAEFDLGTIGAGLIIMTGSVLVVLMYSVLRVGIRARVEESDGEDVSPVILSGRLVGRSIIGAISGGLFAYGSPVGLASVGKRIGYWGLMSQTLYMTIFGIAMGAQFGFITGIRRFQGAKMQSVGDLNSTMPPKIRIVTTSSLKSLIPQSVSSWLVVVLLAGWAGSLGSNSFVVWERATVHYCLSTIAVWLGGLAVRRAHRNKSVRAGSVLSAATPAVIFLVASRISLESRFCRDEQIPWCTSTFYPPPRLSSEPVAIPESPSLIYSILATLLSLHLSSPEAITMMYALVPVAVAILIPRIVQFWLRRSSPTSRLTPSQQVWFRFGLRTALWLAAAYWLLDSAETVGLIGSGSALGGMSPDGGSGHGSNSDATNHRNVALPALSQLGGNLQLLKTGLAQAVVYVSLAFGGCLFWFFKASDTTELDSDSSMSDDSDAVEGPAFSPFIAISAHASANRIRALMGLTMLFPVLVVFSKPLGGGALALALIQILCLGSLTMAQSPTDIAPPSGLTALALGLIGTNTFFATGHAAVLATVQWDAAFIALRTVVYPWSPLSVLINTFAGAILCTASLPLLSASPSALASSNKAAAPTSVQLRLARTSRLTRMACIILATEWSLLLAAAATAALLRRHLMLFRVFCPRVLVAAISGAVIVPAGIVAATVMS